MREPTPNSFPHPDNIINENRQNIRHHIKPKTSLNNNNNPDTTSMNLNNNNINIANNNHKAKLGVQQVNTSSKMLDNQKYQKYFSKRKLVAQYEQEMQQEKRNRTGESINDDDDDDNNNQPLNMQRSHSTTEDESRPDSAKSVGLNLIQNIKMEKGENDHTDVNGNEDNGGETIGFYGTHMGKIKHSILEPNIVLQHSDEVLSPTNGNKSIASTLQNNTNMSQKTAS